MNEKFFLRLLAVSSAHAEMSRNAFTELGLTEGQPKILYILRRNDGIVQKDLADYCGIRQSTLTVLLTKLEAQGFIHREACHISGGKRAFKIYLTDEGHLISNKLEDVVDELEHRCFKGFTIEEHSQLLHMLAKIEENIKDEK